MPQSKKPIMLLEFEKPIADLESKLQEMKDLAKGRNINLTPDIQSLEDKIQTLKKETFQNLTRWQRVQLSRHADRPYALDYIYEITNDFIELHQGIFKVVLFVIDHHIGATVRRSNRSTRERESRYQRIRSHRSPCIQSCHVAQRH